mgnify:FL=1
MRNSILTIIFSLLAVFVYGQVEFPGTLPIGTYSASQSGGGAGFWQLSGSFVDQTGQTDASSVQVGDFVCFTDGAYTFFLPVTEIVFASPPSLIVKVNNTGITQISAVPSGNKGIFRGNDKGLFPFISGLSNADQQAVMSYNMKLIADQLGNTGSPSKYYDVNEMNLSLADSTELLSVHDQVFINIRRNTGDGSVNLPIIDESLRNTEFVIQAWVETGGTPVGVFPGGGEEFIDGTSAGSYTSDALLIVQNGDRVICKPVYDSTALIWYWSTIRVKSEAFLSANYVSSASTTPNVLYVAKYGDDSNTGTLYKPFLTIGAALTAATSGTLIYVREGTYSELELPLKDNVNFFFESVTAGATGVSTEGLFNSPLFLANTDDLDVKISGSLTAYQLVEISKKRLKLDVDGYLIGQTFLGPGTNHASVNIRAKLTPSTVYQFAGSADTITRNYVSYVVDTWTSYATYALNQHYPIAFFNNTSTRPKLNNYNIEIGSVRIQQWGDFYSNRGIIQSRGVSAAWDSCTISVNIGKGQFNAAGVNVANFGLLAFWPYGAATGNQLNFNCDDCLFYNRSVLFNDNFNMQGTDVQRITGKYRTFNKLDIFASTGNFNTTNKAFFDGEFYSRDTTLFQLANPSNFVFSGRLINAESDDPTIIANWANGSTRPTLRNVVIESPATTPITSTTATTWYVDRATETNTVTKDADITYTNVDVYDNPVNLYTSNGDIPTGTTRYINFGPGAAYGYLALGGGTSNAQMDAAGYNYKYNADWAFNPYASANSTAGHGFSNFNMYSRLYGGQGPRFSRMYQEAFRNSTTAGYQMTNYMNIYMQSQRKFFGYYNHMDSIGNVMISGIKFKSDSITTGGRAHFLGALKNGYTTGTERFYHPTTFLGLQTATYNSNTRYNWFGADDLDAGTIGTGNKVFMYGGATTGYYFPNGTMSTTSGEVSILNWLGTGSGVTPRISRIGDALSGTARIVPYMNSNGRLVLTNTYFRADTTTAAGALARVRLNLNKTFDITSPDSYTVLDVFAGDAANAGANMFVGDQTLGYVTAGYDARMMLYRYGGSLNAASNIANGNSLGRYGFGGYVNGSRNNNLSGIFSTYRGDGTTTLADLDGRYSNGVIGWRLDEVGKFWLGTGGAGYFFPPSTAPATGSGVESELVWDGTGSGATPRFRVPKRDTTVSYNNLDYNLLTVGLTDAQVLTRYNNIIVTGYVPSSGVTSDALFFLPNASANYNQVTIWLTSLDENATYGIGISAATDDIALGDGTYTNQYPGGPLPVGATVRIRCQIDPKSGTSTYKWFLN